MALIPIYKDYRVSLGTTSPVMFRVNGTYVGKAFSPSAGADVKVRINDIYADLLRPNTLEEVMSEKDVFQEAASLTAPIKVEKSTDGGEIWSWVVNGTDSFLYDWSYDYSSRGLATYTVLSSPVTGRVTPQSHIPMSFVSSDVYPYVKVVRDGTVVDSILIDSTSEDAVGTVLMDAATLQCQAGDKVVLEQDGDILMTYDVIDGCHRYALYYTNPLGGMDIFIPEGETKRSCDITRHSHGKDYDNSSRYIFGGNTSVYAEEVADKLSLVSGLLTDEQSAKMKNLFTAPSLYVYDMVDDLLYPAISVDGSFTEQTYRQNGLKLSNYTLSLEVSLDKARV